MSGTVQDVMLQSVCNCTLSCKLMKMPCMSMYTIQSYTKQGWRFDKAAHVISNLSITNIVRCFKDRKKVVLNLAYNNSLIFQWLFLHVCVIVSATLSFQLLPETIDIFPL